MWLCCCVHITARPHRLGAHQNPWIFMTCPSKGSPEALPALQRSRPSLRRPASVRIPAGHRWLSNHHRSSTSANSSQDPLQIFDLISLSSLDHRTCRTAARDPTILRSCTRSRARCTRACAHAPACSPLQPGEGGGILLSANGL